MRTIRTCCEKYTRVPDAGLLATPRHEATKSHGILANPPKFAISRHFPHCEFHTGLRPVPLDETTASCHARECGHPGAPTLLSGFQASGPPSPTSFRRVGPLDTRFRGYDNRFF